HERHELPGGRQEALASQPRRRHAVGREQKHRGRDEAARAISTVGYAVPIEIEEVRPDAAEVAAGGHPVGDEVRAGGARRARGRAEVGASAGEESQSEDQPGSTEAGRPRPRQSASHGAPPWTASLRDQKGPDTVPPRPAYLARRRQAIVKRAAPAWRVPLALDARLTPAR